MRVRARDGGARDPSARDAVRRVPRQNDCYFAGVGRLVDFAGDENRTAAVNATGTVAAREV